MEQTEKFAILINYINNIEKIRNNPLIIEANNLRDFKNYFENFNNEMLINSNSINDKLRLKKINKTLRNKLCIYFNQYLNEYRFLIFQDEEKYTPYKESFEKIDKLLKNESFEIKQVFDLAEKITRQKVGVYSPIFSLNGNPLTRVSLRFCFVLNFLKIFSSSDCFKETLKDETVETKADTLSEHLNQYGFSELEKIKALSEPNKILLIKRIAENDLPYAIAMFDYLEFIQYLEENYFDTKAKLNKEISKWFDKDEKGRAVKGNISTLSKHTNEDKKRYTAHLHKENVINEYLKLK